MKVFLDGTNSNSDWKDIIVKYLRIDYEKDSQQKDSCDAYLYVFTPKMTSVHPLSELFNSVRIHPERTVFCFMAVDGDKNFDCGQMEILNGFGKELSSSGAYWASSLEDAAWILNRMDGREHEVVIL